ncbi:MAG: hypothetical protein ACTSPT_00735, partial [Candidatus Heimdallarchaeota archaeon]
MSGQAFQYYAFLMDYNKESHQMNMLLLPAKASPIRIQPIERSKLQFIVEKELRRPYKYTVYTK